MYVDAEIFKLTSKTTWPNVESLTQTASSGDLFSINGDILTGKQQLSPPNFKGSDNISRFMAIVDSTRKMKVLANPMTRPRLVETAQKESDSPALRIIPRGLIIVVWICAACIFVVSG